MPAGFNQCLVARPAHRALQSDEIVRTVLPESFVGRVIRVREEVADGRAESGHGRKLGQSHAVDEPERAELLRVSGGKACGDRAPSR